MTGLPIPYCMNSDNLILSLFMLDMLGYAYLLPVDGGNIAERMKNMFYYTGNSTPYKNSVKISLTGSVILYAQTIFHCAVITMGILLQRGEHDICSAPHTAFAICAAACTLFLPAKRIVYDFVNNVLFGAKQAEQWRSSYFFTIQITGTALWPLAAATILAPAVHPVILYGFLIAMLVIYFAMLSMRCFNIIFTGKHCYLDIFLYLCAIELLPLGLAWRSIQTTDLL